MVKHYSTGLEIKKKILHALREGPVSLRKLETKLNTGYIPLKRHCKELEFLGMLNVKQQKMMSKNGRPYTVVELTELGKKTKL